MIRKENRMDSPGERAGNQLISVSVAMEQPCNFEQGGQKMYGNGFGLLKGHLVLNVTDGAYFGRHRWCLFWSIILTLIS